MNIDDLLNSTKPILYETGVEEWPYALSGTCYPVKFRATLFVISAFHCYSNFGIEPEDTLYPRPDDPRGFFAFDTKFRAHSPQAKDNEHYDQVVLRVAKSHHSQAEIDKVSALDLANPGNSRLPTSPRIKDFSIRGYPFDAPKHGINYDLKIISEQAYTTNGCLTVNKAPFDFCYLIRMLTPIPNGMSPNAMSGTPVYGITYDNKPVYCGTIIQYNGVTREYLAIGPEVLVNALKRL
jgi:hypothetical protein